MLAGASLMGVAAPIGRSAGAHAVTGVGLIENSRRAEQLLTRRPTASDSRASLSLRGLIAGLAGSLSSRDSTRIKRTEWQDARNTLAHRAGNRLLRHEGPWCI